MSYIFISASRDNLGFARHVRGKLELSGYSTWIGERTDFVIPADVQHVMDVLIEAAGVVIAIEGGVSGDLAAAERFGKPIFYMSLQDDPEALIPEIAFAMPDVVEPLQSPLPEPLDVSSVRALQDEFVNEQRLSVRIIVAGAVIIMAVMLLVVTWVRSGANSQMLVTPPVSNGALGQLVGVVTDEPTATVTPPPTTPAVSATAIATSQTPASATPVWTETASLTASPTARRTATATRVPPATQVLTLPPTASVMPTDAPASPVAISPALPSLGSTLIPAGTGNEAWHPIERVVRGMVVVYVPGGCFTVQAEQGEVTNCVEPFWIGKTEVTNAQYAACVRAGACSVPVRDDSRMRQSYYYNPDFADFPVIHVTWSQASDFSRWFGGSLPTETQWRFAAEGPSSWLYPWGSDAPMPNLLNFNGAHGDVTQTGAFPSGASWVGALDMAGNVWEWTDTVANRVNRVVCGGSWTSYEGLVRAASRAEIAFSDSNAYTGFRIVVDATTLR